MIVTERFRYHWTAGLVPIIVGLPVFVSVGADGIGLPTGPSVVDRGVTIGVPVSLAVITIATLGAVTGLRARRHRLVTPVFLVVFVAVNAIALLWGSLSGRFSVGSLAFFAQTMLPLTAYVYGTQLFVNRTNSLAKTYLPMFLVPLLSIVAIGLTTLLEGGRPWVDLGQRLGPLEIPQILRYVPTVFAAALVGFAHHHLIQGRPKWHTIALALTPLALLASVHTRTSLLIVIAGVLVTIVGDPTRAGKGKRLVLVGWIALGVFVLVAALPQLSDGPVALGRLVGGDAAAQLSSERRYDALISSFTESFGSPFGRAYAAAENLSLGGAESAFSRVSNSENQLGEFGLRAGPMAIIAIIAFLISALRDARRLLRSSAGDETSRLMASIWVATVATLLGSTFTQQPLSQPFPGLYLWLMLGLLRGWTLSQRIDSASTVNEPGRTRVSIVTH